MVVGNVQAVLRRCPELLGYLVAVHDNEEGAFTLAAYFTSEYYIRRSSYPLIGWLVDHVWATTSPTITWWAGRRIFVC